MADQSTQQFPKPSDPRQHTVLIVDDEPALLRGLERTLSLAGFDVVTAKDGDTAIQQLKNASIDVVLTDIELGGMSGVDLLRIVRAYDLDVPVIFMTGKPTLDTAIEAVSLGALQYLVKPLDEQALTKTLARASKLHRIALLRREAMKRDGEIDPRASDRAGLMALFDAACRKLDMVFQPIVNVRRRAVIGYEALVRSSEPALSTPGTLLTAARKLNSLPRLGRQIRSRIATDIARLSGDCLIFVNIDTADLSDPALFSTEGELSQLAERVVFELSEQGEMELVRDLGSRVSLLRNLGYRIAVDDFGAAQGGLKSLALLEPDYVKLDMSLVREIHVSSVQQKLVEAVMSLSSDMQATVTAEGVERVEERDTLGRMGCEIMQGYLFARPSPSFPAPSEQSFVP